MRSIKVFDGESLEKALIVSDQCMACKALLKELGNKGLLDKYKVINVNTPEGLDVVQKLGISAVPDCIVIMRDKDGDVARRCTDEETKKIWQEATEK